MRILATVVVSVLAAGAILAPGGAAVRADAPEDREQLQAAPAPDERPAPLPGTADEAREYERREAESPEVQEFVGGGWVIELLVIAALVLLIILLVREI